MLYAYDPNAPGVVAFAQQFKAVVGEEFHNRVEIYDEYLDLNRFPDHDRSPQLAPLLRREVSGFRPDAIVAEGTRALRFATERLSSLFPGVPIVYGYAFEPIVDFSALPANVTGRRQPLPFVSTYSLARALQPDAERVVVVSGASEMDSLLLSVALREITPLLNGMELEVLQDWSYESLIDSLRRIPPRTFVIFSSFSRDQRGRKFNAGDLIASLTRVTSAPVYGIVAQLGRRRGRRWWRDGFRGRRHAHGSPPRACPSARSGRADAPRGGGRHPAGRRLAGAAALGLVRGPPSAGHRGPLPHAVDLGALPDDHPRDPRRAPAASGVDPHGCWSSVAGDAGRRPRSGKARRVRWSSAASSRTWDASRWWASCRPPWPTR